MGAEMKKREGDSWMPAAEFGRSLSGVGINVLVPDIDQEREFHTYVLGADEVYADADFAVYRGYGAMWLLHADHTYSDHPLYGSLSDELVRGIGAEFRVYGCDPDTAEARARERGYEVFAGALDKPHGLREAYLMSPSGYMWVPSAAVGKSEV